MNKTIKIKTIYDCHMKSKGATVQRVEFTPDVPFGFYMDFKNESIDLNDLKLIHKFLGGIIEDQEKLNQ